MGVDVGETPINKRVIEGAEREEPTRHVEPAIRGWAKHPVIASRHD